MHEQRRIMMLQRPYPSANMALVTGPRPVLIDTGAGSDLPETERLLAQLGVPARSLHLIVNTHAHVDHVGGNHGLQRAHGIPVAAGAADAGRINGRHPNACDASFLDHTVEPFTVDRILAPGDELDTGAVVLQVLATPGHTPDHLSFYAPELRVLVLGDVMHRDDVAWLNLCAGGPDPVEQILATLDRLAALPVAWACSGHGAPIHDFPAAVDGARRRYESWRAQPERIGWHACKRIFGYAIMLEGGMTFERVEAYLLGAPWFCGYSRRVFGQEPADFVAPLVAEMLRAGAARWEGARLVPATPYSPVSPDWLARALKPDRWPCGAAPG